MKLLAAIANTNKKLLAYIGVVIAVAVAIAMYYLLMPAWVIVIRSGEDENALPSIDSRFKVAEDDLAKFPSLREAITQADGNYPYDHWIPPVNAGYLEGKKIVERFQMSSSYPPEYKAVLIYESNNAKKVYHVQVVFDYEQIVQQ